MERRFQALVHKYRPSQEDIDAIDQVVLSQISRVQKAKPRYNDTSSFNFYGEQSQALHSLHNQTQPSQGQAKPHKIVEVIDFDESNQALQNNFSRGASHDPPQ